MISSLLEVSDGHGFGMRLAVLSKMRYIGIITQAPSRTWWNTYWFPLLMNAKNASLEQVYYKLINELLHFVNYLTIFRSATSFVLSIHC